MINNRENRFKIHHMRNAMNAQDMSYGKIRKVGAVIVRDNRTIVNAWNGSIVGADNCIEEHVVTCECGKEHKVELLNGLDSSDNFHWLECSCGKTLTPNNSTVVYRVKRSAIHAEENAILYAAKIGIPLKGSSLYTTCAPCLRCARMIISCGIVKVYYLEEFKNTLGLDLFREHSVATEQIPQNILS